MKNKLTAFLVTTLTLAQAIANPVRTSPIVGGIAYAGSGCPAGTARMEIGNNLDRNSLDRNNLTFIFDNYSVSTNGRQMARASCNIVIPVEVPRGYALILPQIGLAGVTRLQRGDNAKLNAEVFLAGAQGSVQSRVLDSSNNGTFTFIANSNNRQQTPCGQSINLRVNTSVFLKGNYNSGSYVDVNKMKLNIPLTLVACRN